MEDCREKTDSDDKESNQGSNKPANQKRSTHTHCHHHHCNPLGSSTTHDSHATHRPENQVGRNNQHGRVRMNKAIKHSVPQHHIPPHHRGGGRITAALKSNRATWETSSIVHNNK